MVAEGHGADGNIRREEQGVLRGKESRDGGEDGKTGQHLSFLYPMRQTL